MSIETYEPEFTEPLELHEHYIPIDETNEVHQLLTGDDPQLIGKMLLIDLMSKMAELKTPAPSMLAVGKKGIAVTFISQPTNYDRHAASRQSGRYFAHALEDDEVQYIIQILPAWIGSGEDPNVTATKDPHRREAAVCHVSDVRHIHEATDLDEYLQALKDWPNYVWQCQMREGIPTEVDFDGDRYWPTSRKDELKDDPEKDNYVYLDNYLLTQCFIGIGANFKANRFISENPDTMNRLDEMVDDYEKNVSQSENTG